RGRRAGRPAAGRCKGPGSAWRTTSGDRPRCRACRSSPTPDSPGSGRGGRVNQRDLERLAKAGVYGPADTDAPEQRAVLERLLAQGVTIDELVGTPRLGGLVLRAFEADIQPGERLTLARVAAA